MTQTDRMQLSTCWDLLQGILTRDPDPAILDSIQDAQHGIENALDIYDAKQSAARAERMLALLQTYSLKLQEIDAI